jgi:PilZ domain
MGERAVVLADIEDRLTSRAQRFAIRIPLQYRVQATNTWRRGDTINISSSGVLFRGDYLPELNTPVELKLIMPAVKSEGAAEVICRGTIIRAIPSLKGDSRPALALKILQYHLVHAWNARDER